MAAYRTARPYSLRRTDVKPPSRPVKRQPTGIRTMARRFNHVRRRPKAFARFTCRLYWRREAPRERPPWTMDQLDPRLANTRMVRARDGTRTCCKFMRYHHHVRTPVDGGRRPESVKAPDQPEQQRWATRDVIMPDPRGTWSAHRPSIAPDLAPFMSVSSKAALVQGPCVWTAPAKGCRRIAPLNKPREALTREADTPVSGCARATRDAVRPP